MINVEQLDLSGNMSPRHTLELTLSKLVSLKPLFVHTLELNYSDFISNLNSLDDLKVPPTADFAAIAKQKNIDSLVVFI